MKWNKDGHEVKFDDRVKASSDGKTYRLTITDARLDDAEQYIITLPDGKKSKAMLKVDGTCEGAEESQTKFCRRPSTQSQPITIHGGNFFS